MLDQVTVPRVVKKICYSQQNHCEKLYHRSGQLYLTKNANFLS